jgi:tetratricopeptide (TPR) repeat protein
VTTTLRSTEAVENTDYSTAIEYYNIRDFGNAAHYFSKVLSNDRRYWESIMLIGVSGFEEENYPEAKHSFTKVIDDNNSLFLEDAQWYLALCYLKTGEKEKAINSLTFIRRSSSIYSDDARKILRKMR